MKTGFVILLALVGSAASAQHPGTTVVAHILDVRDGAFVSGAEVTVVGTELRGRSDSLGRVAIAGVRPGAVSIEARHLGFKPAVTQLMVSGADSLEVVVAMSPTSQALPGMKVTETAAAIHLREFDERLRNHIGGYFITDSVIRKAEADGIVALLHARVPGIRSRALPGGIVKVYSSRGQTNLKGDILCEVEVFVDGVRLGDGDAGVLPLMDIAGIEFYPPSFAPPQYRIPSPVGKPTGGAACGVLLLWTRP